MVQKKLCLSTFFCHFLFFLTFLLLSTTLISQNGLWTSVAKHVVNEEKVANLKTYQLFRLDESLFLEKIKTSFSTSKQSTLPITIALPTHTLSTIDLVASPIIEAPLSAKYPTIQSFLIESKQDKTLQGRISWTPKGLYGHLIANTESFFIENAGIKGQEDIYLVYQASDFINNTDQRLICGNPALESMQPTTPQYQATTALNTDLKTFRLAITATEQFTNATGGTVESTLSAIVNTLTSLNVIYERDAGIRFLLHKNNDQLIFTDSFPSPFEDPGSAFELLTTHTPLLDSLIGPDTYDLGHVFAAECTGGVAGVAFLASACSASNKARAVSCIFDEGIADFRRTLYHEIGHQLGANHTWSNCGRQVNEGQRNATTAVEPGSGSTIMSYGGICGSFNVVGTALDHLHGISIQEINSALTSDTITCFQQIPTANTAPIVSVRESGFTIPIATPFELNATASDAENTTLTYSWEQFDTGAVSEVGFPIENAPSFIAFRPIRESFRIFPRATTIILNRTSSGEVLPDTTRQLTFGVTVRDNQEGGGSTTFAKVAFIATAEAGPFQVLQPDSANIEYEMGDSIVVRWDAANTIAEPVNCANVAIYLSFDNGQEFPELLAANIPNNGETMVVLPDTTTNRARIKVKCADNIFFDMSNNRFRITEKNILSSTIDFYNKPIRLYPNPATDKIMLEFSEVPTKDVILTIYDALGRNVFYEKRAPHHQVLELNTSHFQKGVYLLKGKIDQQIFSKRFIVNE